MVFLSAGTVLGGAQISLLALVGALAGTVRAVLMAPPVGPLVERLRSEGLVAEHVVIADRLTRGQLWARVSVFARGGLWMMRNRRRIRAVHANGDSELTYLIPLLPLLAWSNVPVIVWYHSRSLAPWTARLAWLWRRLHNHIVWVPVSDASARELEAANITATNCVVIGNPIDANLVAGVRRPVRSDDRLVLGYLGFENEIKGILVLPGIAAAVRDLPVQIVCVTKEWPPERNSPAVNTALDALRALQPSVRFEARDHDVRNVYEQIDALLVPSLSESFCRIAAEAMVNHQPVVASDLPALREVCGDDEAALFFPPGDAAAAANCVRRLVEERGLYDRLAAGGGRRAQRFDPARIASQFAELYRSASRREPVGQGPTGHE